MYQIAQNVISKFGGAYKFAEILGVDTSQVYRWTYEKERGGTGGKIPARHFPAILKASEKLNIDIALNELIPVPKAKTRTRKQ